MTTSARDFDPATPTERCRLFVYGTLKRGFCRHFAIAEQTFLGEARTRPLYRLYDCGDYPALVRGEGGFAVCGELWDVHAACLPRIDELEGVDIGLFARRPVELEPPHEGPAISYFYCLDVTGLRRCGHAWP